MGGINLWWGNSTEGRLIQEGRVRKILFSGGNSSHSSPLLKTLERAKKFVKFFFIFFSVRFQDVLIVSDIILFPGCNLSYFQIKLHYIIDILNLSSSRNNFESGSLWCLW